MTLAQIPEFGFFVQNSRIGVNRIIVLLKSVAIGNRTLLKNGLFWNDKKFKDLINKAY